MYQFQVIDYVHTNCDCLHCLSMTFRKPLVKHYHNYIVAWVMHIWYKINVYSNNLTNDSMHETDAYYPPVYKKVTYLEEVKAHSYINNQTENY